MKRSESWVNGLVQQKVFMRIGRIPAIARAGTHKRTAEPKKPKQEAGVFVVGKSVVGEGDLI